MGSTVMRSGSLRRPILRGNVGAEHAAKLICRFTAPVTIRAAFWRADQAGAGSLRRRPICQVPAARSLRCLCLRFRRVEHAARLFRMQFGPYQYPSGRQRICSAPAATCAIPRPAPVRNCYADLGPLAVCSVDQIALPPLPSVFYSAAIAASIVVSMWLGSTSFASTARDLSK